MKFRGNDDSEGGDTGPWLVADFGGTNARFGVVHPDTGSLEEVDVLACADFARAEDAIRAYVKRHGIRGLTRGCIAAAGPVDQDPVDLPNNHWTLYRRQLEELLGVPVLLINDFTAQALCIDHLEEDQLVWLGTPRPAERGIRTVVGPGTGLGVAIQTTGGEVIPSEAGHVGFAPTSRHGIELLQALLSRFPRVSVERIVSGPGLENLYWANYRLADAALPLEGALKSAREVAELASRGNSAALQSVQDFFDVLASFAGDMALATWATGGVFLSGGAFRKLLPFFDPERFRAHFEDKGRFTRFCETVPVAWIRPEYPGLIGCAAVLDGWDPQGDPFSDEGGTLPTRVEQDPDGARARRRL
ncbi:MAG: glucokinase [Gemmatimonadota bacterium]